MAPGLPVWRTDDPIEWHKDLSIEARRTVLAKLIEALKTFLPRIDSGSFEWTASQFEREVYMNAASTKEYYNMIAEKLYLLKSNFHNSALRQPWFPVLSSQPIESLMDDDDEPVLSEVD